MSKKIFSSGEIEVQKTVSEIYAFISDFNNFQTLLPPQVSNWNSTSDTCSFTIEGMPPLSLRIQERIPLQKVLMVPESSPIPFELHCNMAENGSGSKVEVRIETEISGFMGMMLKRPFEQFVKTLGEKLKSM